MAIAEELQIIVDVKVSQAIKDMKKVDATLGNTGKATNKLSDTFKNLAGPVAIGAIVAGFISVGKESSKLAAIADETESKFRVVFGDTADIVSDWASNYSDSVGRSESDTLNFLGVIGDTLKPLGFAKDAVDSMSTQVVELAGDLASFNNLPTEEVIAGIQSALVGNVETLRRYGVVANETSIKQEAINSGLWDGTGALTAQEKAQAILNITMAGTTDAQGDLARTQDSTANTFVRLESATKDLKIQLGKSINEGIAPMAGATATLVSNFAQWLEKSREVKAAMAEITGGNEAQTRSLEVLDGTIEKFSNDLKVLLAERVSARGEELEAIKRRDKAEEDSLRASIAVAEEQKKVLLEVQKGEAQNARFRQVYADEIAIQAAEQNKIEETNAENQKDTATRQEIQNELLKEFVQINEQVTAGLIEGNGELEKESALRESLNELIEEGFTAQGRGFELITEAAEAFGVVLTENKATYKEMFNEAMEQLSDYADATDETVEAAKISWDSLAQSILGSMSGLFSSLAQLQRQNTENQIAELDAQLEATLAAAGLSEETTQERLDNQLAAAIAEGDAEKIAAAQQAADRNVIVEDFERKKAQAEYKGALSSWKLSKASAIATGAQAIIGGFASKPFLPVGIAMGALATVETGIQIAAINGSRPTPAFAQGGSFLTNGTQNIQVGDNMGGVERVTVEPVSSAGANESFGGGNQTIYLVVDGKQFTAHIQKQINNRALRSSVGGAI